MISRLNAEKDAFLKDRKLPTSDVMIAPLIEYEMALHKARKSLVDAYTNLSAQYTALGQDAKNSELSDEKAAIDRAIAGGGNFQLKTDWVGTRHLPDGKSVDFRLVVGNFDGNTFGGTVFTAESHVEFRVRGILDGNRIHFETTEIIKGGQFQLAFDVFVLDRRMILDVSGATVQGKPATGMVTMARR